MPSVRTSIVSAIIIGCIFISAVAAAYYLNTDYGNVEAEVVSIESEHGQISGLLYKPHSATSEYPQPVVVLAHGISSAKQSLSSIALELARNGIVALSIDLLGHGGSEGQLANGEEDATLGVLATVRHMESQAFVNSTSIGLVGHSLGAGAIRAAAVAHGNISAAVFIGGGFGSMVADPAYGTLNRTFPKNLLIAVGKYDVLFNLNELKATTLPPIFGTPQVDVDVFYGSFSNQNARELITPATTHLFEPIDPAVVSETVEWLVNALQPNCSNGHYQNTRNLLYVYRDEAIIISIVALIGLVFLISTLALKAMHYSAKKVNVEALSKGGSLENWKVLIIWGGLSLLLFFPMVLVGLMINVPPVIFGASIAWWALATALTGLVALVLLSRVFKSKLDVRRAFSHAFDIKGTGLAIAMFILLYLVAGLVEAYLALGLGIFVPFFRAIRPVTRVPVFLMFLPFFLAYFVVEGLFLHEFRQSCAPKSGYPAEILGFVEVLGLRVSPYLAILLLQYLPLVLSGFQLFPSFAGFLIEFLWLLTPIFTISAANSWWFYRSTLGIGTGAVLNSLIFAWIGAGLFPF